MLKAVKHLYNTLSVCFHTKVKKLFFLGRCSSFFAHTTTSRANMYVCVCPRIKCDKMFVNSGHRRRKRASSERRILSTVITIHSVNLPLKLSYSPAEKWEAITHPNLMVFHYSSQIPICIENAPEQRMWREV